MENVTVTRGKSSLEVTMEYYSIDLGPGSLRIYLSDIVAFRKLVGHAVEREYVQFALKDGRQAWVELRVLRNWYGHFIGTFDWATPQGAVEDPMEWIMYYGRETIGGTLPSPLFGQLVRRSAVDLYVIRRLTEILDGE